MSVAVIVAVGVTTEGQREVLGLKVGASVAEPFWTEFLRSLNRRGLRGVKLVISDSHEGIKAAVSKVLKATGDADLVRNGFVSAADYLLAQARSVGYRIKGRAYNNKVLVVVSE